jgi:hypothetical protein
MRGRINGRFCSWMECGRDREHVGDVERAVSQLTELMRSLTETTPPPTPHALPVAFQRPTRTRPSRYPRFAPT